MRLERRGVLGRLILGALLGGCKADGAIPPPPSRPVASPPMATTQAPAATTGRVGGSPPSSPRLAGSPLSASHEAIVYSPGRATRDPHVRALVGRERLTKPAEKRILDAVFPRGYLADDSRCRAAGGGLDAARASGDFAPSVVEAATGCFTVPRTEQTLYLISNQECGASHAENYGSATLAVFDAEQVAAQANIVGGSSISGVLDIDGDGTNEIVLTSGFSAQGSSTVSARLLGIGAEKVETIKDFGEVYSGGCGSGFAAQNEAITVIYFTPGSPPIFRTEKQTRACP